MKRVLVVLIVLGALAVFVVAIEQGFIKTKPGMRPVKVTWVATGYNGTQVKPYCMLHDYPLDRVTLTCPETGHDLIWEVSVCPICGGTGKTTPVGGGAEISCAACGGTGRVGETEARQYQEMLKLREQSPTKP